MECTNEVLGVCPLQGITLEAAAGMFQGRLPAQTIWEFCDYPSPDGRTEVIAVAISDSAEIRNSSTELRWVLSVSATHTLLHFITVHIVEFQFIIVCREATMQLPNP